MALTDARLEHLAATNLTPDQRAMLRCRIAAEYIDAGQYEAALEALGQVWLGVGERPALQGLAVSTAAEVLLQCGVLSGWLGSVQQIAGAQDKAKDLMTEALRIFQSLNQPSRAAEAQQELATCYWRAGAFDEARVILDQAILGLGDKDVELQAKILIRRTVVEISEGRYHEAWNILKEANPIFEGCSDALKGRWHGQRGLVLRRLATAEGRADYADRAIIEFTAAIYHYEQAKHERYCGNNLNNLAMLLYKLGRYAAAHEHLDRARRIFERLNDPGNRAQVDETRARVLVAEHRYEEARRVIVEVVDVLERGGEQALFADALTIKATVQSRLGDHELSLRSFHRAISTAEDAGALTNAGLAAIAMIEEHGQTRLSEAEIYEAYRRADELLAATEDGEDIARLRACARMVTRRLFGKQLDDPNFSLPDVMSAYEARYIEQALKEEEGSVTRAAKRLGLNYQALCSMLNGRHQSLLHQRKPAVRRKRSIMWRRPPTQRH